MAEKRLSYSYSDGHIRRLKRQKLNSIMEEAYLKVQSINSADDSVPLDLPLNLNNEEIDVERTLQQLNEINVDNSPALNLVNDHSNAINLLNDSVVS